MLMDAHGIGFSFSLNINRGRGRSAVRCFYNVFEGAACRTQQLYECVGRGEGAKGGHVLRDTTSRGLCVRVWPPHTSERRGGGGGCEQEGWQGGEGRARMSGQEERQG